MFNTYIKSTCAPTSMYLNVVLIKILDLKQLKVAWKIAESLYPMSWFCAVETQLSELIDLRNHDLQCKQSVVSAQVNNEFPISADSQKQ